MKPSLYWIGYPVGQNTLGNMWLPHVVMTRHSNTSAVVNHFVFTGEGWGNLCLLDPVLTLQQVAQNQISFNLCSLPRWVNSVMEANIFTEILQYTWHDLLLPPVTGTCYCTQGWVYCRGNLLPTVFRLFYEREVLKQNLLFGVGTCSILRDREWWEVPVRHLYSQAICERLSC